MTRPCQINSSIPLAAIVGAPDLLTGRCGDRPVDRALTGGAIGAGKRAGAGSAFDHLIAGAVIGASASATIGAVTAPGR